MTKKQRNNVYKKMLEYLLQTWEYKNLGVFHDGLCYLMIYTYPGKGYDIRDFPELIKHKPRNAGVYWWNKDKRGTDKRIQVLLMAYTETL